MEAVHLLDALVDESDPDTDLPNSVHAFQTAERIRSVHPDKDWFHLTGLLHDLGKVMALWGEPQYCVVGDSFPLGCKFSEHIVFHETFENNPDTKVPEYRYVLNIFFVCGLEVALWLVNLTLDCSVWVLALARFIMLHFWARHLLPQCHSPPGVQMGTREFNAGGNSVMH